ncbi:MAG: STAS domain-containing protein [Verrucomicrobiota bacterium]
MSKDEITVKKITIGSNDLLSAANSHILDDEVNRVLKDLETWQCLVVDITNIRFLDSTGINKIAGMYKAMSQYDKKVKVLTSSPTIIKSFSRTGLDKHIEVEVS